MRRFVFAGSQIQIVVPTTSTDRATLGVGPAGAYVSKLDEAWREALRTRCAELLPPGAVPPVRLRLGRAGQGLRPGGVPRQTAAFL
jgi:hypothetical protein